MLLSFDGSFAFPRTGVLGVRVRRRFSRPGVAFRHVWTWSQCPVRFIILVRPSFLLIPSRRRSVRSPSYAWCESVPSMPRATRGEEAPSTREREIRLGLPRRIGPVLPSPPSERKVGDPGTPPRMDRSTRPHGTPGGGRDGPLHVANGLAQGFPFSDGGRGGSMRDVPWRIPSGVVVVVVGGSTSFKVFLLVPGPPPLRRSLWTRR